VKLYLQSSTDQRPFMHTPHTPHTPLHQIRDLKDEIHMLRGGGPQRGPLTPDEIARLEARVRAFITGGSGGGGEGAAALTAGGDLMAIRACE